MKTLLITQGVLEMSFRVAHFETKGAAHYTLAWTIHWVWSGLLDSLQTWARKLPSTKAIPREVISYELSAAYTHSS